MAHTKHNWAAGDLISAERLNNMEKQYDAVTELLRLNSCSARFGTRTTVPSGNNVIKFDSVNFDPSGAFNPTDTPNLTYTRNFKAPVAGRYLVSSQIFLQIVHPNPPTAKDPFTMFIELRKNSTVYRRSQGKSSSIGSVSDLTLNLVSLIDLAAGDSVYMTMQVSTGATYLYPTVGGTQSFAGGNCFMDIMLQTPL